jgi:ribosomal protein S9
MDEKQSNHLKAYGVTYWALEQGVEVKWLVNYRGGSFLVQHQQAIASECLVRGITFENLADGQANNLLNEISREDVNQDAVSMQKAPKIAVYSPPNKQPWDDAVTLVLKYAEIKFDVIYDEEILNGKLKDYDWLHLHHEDFTGQFGKFFQAYQHVPWYQEEVRTNRELAQKMGFLKVSEMKKVIARDIHRYIENGGFLFAMCAATDTYDIAQAAQGIDICESMYDGDPADPAMNEKLDFANTLAFQNFVVNRNPYEYNFSNIDVSSTRKVPREQDYFTLFQFSAPLAQYFPLETQQSTVQEPLNLTDTLGQFDALITVRGGGVSGQAGAIRHGISKALLLADPDLRPTLKQQGFLTRDSRIKERKKYGQKKARKRFQYSKR